MRIGIDARVLFGQKTGDRTYALNLLRNLPPVRPIHEFIAFAKRFGMRNGKGDEVVLMLSHSIQFIFLRSAHEWHFSQIALPASTRALKVDLLHVQYIGPIMLRQRFVTTIHDLSWRRLPKCFPAKHRLLLNLFIPVTVRVAEAIITDSQASRTDLLSYFSVMPEKVHVIPLGASDEFFQPPTESECEEMLSRFGLRKGYALYLGVLQPRKNLISLIEAVALLRDNGMWCNDWILVIAGKFGWHYEGLLRAVERLKLSSVVRFIGYVSDEHIRALYSCARAFVYPSLWEGFGLPVVEAMACGVPVITSNVGALKEVGEGAALLVDPHDVTSIARALHTVMNDDAICDILGKSGRERAAQFTWKKTAEMTAAVYEAVMGSV